MMYNEHICMYHTLDIECEFRRNTKHIHFINILSIIFIILYTNQTHKQYIFHCILKIITYNMCIFLGQMFRNHCN